MSSGDALSRLLRVLKEYPNPESLEVARKSFADKHYKDAATLAGSLAQHATDPQLRTAALLLQAKSLINLSDLTAAESALDQYIYARPQSSEALYLLGFVLQRENKPRESFAIYNRAASLSPPQANDLKLVALDYVLCFNDYADAIFWLKRCLASDPSNAEAWYFLGRAHMQGGDFRGSRGRLPFCAKARRWRLQGSRTILALALAAQNRNEDATNAYRAAIASQATLQTQSEQPYLNLGTLLDEENRSRRGLTTYCSALRRLPAGQSSLS